MPKDPSGSAAAISLRTASFRHLRLFLAAVDGGSLSAAAARLGVTQPAVSHALRRLEREAGGAVLHRHAQGVAVTARGDVLARRVRRAFAILDPALAECGHALPDRVTLAQLHALCATVATENFTRAAASCGLAQPTIHRAVSRLEAEAGRPLFERRPAGLVATRQARALDRAARLAFVELDQAAADLADLGGGSAGRVVLGALPLSRTALLPRALALFRSRRVHDPIVVQDGAYDSLLEQLRRGEIDLLLGALRNPAPDGLLQEPLFEDSLAFLCGCHHPLGGRAGLHPEALAAQGWIVPRAGSPARAQFDALFLQAGLQPPQAVIESGSALLMREMLETTDLLGCIPLAQVAAELRRGLVLRLDVAAPLPRRAIGLTCRADWEPTVAQRVMLDCLREAATVGTGAAGTSMGGRGTLALDSAG